jgi:hypothetical protein
MSLDPPVEGAEEAPAVRIPAPVLAPALARQVAAWVDHQLSTTDTAHFSQPALAEFRLRLDSYGAELVAEARRIAFRHHADSISATYVRQASEHLSASGRRRRFTLIGSAGALLAGAGISNLLDLAWTPSPSGAQALTAAALGIVGTACIVVQLIRE